MKPVIGVDFDNTLVGYERVFHDTAVEMGLITAGVSRSKRGIRDFVRSLPNGEMAWRKLQAVVYGSRMGQAELEPGVDNFFRRCRTENIQVYIISHKTEVAAEGGNNLRAAALGWMRQQRFFERDGWGLREQDVFFEATRMEKLHRIGQLHCTHFIDDLEETFLDPSFPPRVEKILYDPHRQHTSECNARVFASWQEIADYFFHDRP